MRLSVAPALMLLRSEHGMCSTFVRFVCLGHHFWFHFFCPDRIIQSGKHVGNHRLVSTHWFALGIISCTVFLECPGAFQEFMHAARLGIELGHLVFFQRVVEGCAFKRAFHFLALYVVCCVCQSAF